MNNSTGLAIGLLAFLGLGALGLGVILVASRGIGNQSAQSSHLVYGVPVEPQIPVLYENKEEWELVRGPDRLIEKVVIHRMVTQNG